MPPEDPLQAALMCVPPPPPPNKKSCMQPCIKREREYRTVHTCEQTLCTMSHDMHVRNLHTTTCNLLVNFTTPTHSVLVIQVYKQITGVQFYKVFSHLYRVHTMFVCSYAQIDTLSLYVLLTLPVLMLLAVTSYFVV